MELNRLLNQIKRFSFLVFLIGSACYLLYFVPVRIRSDKNGMSYVIGFTESEKIVKLTNGTIVWVVEPGDTLQPDMKYILFRGNFDKVDPEPFARYANLYGIWIGLLEFNESLAFAKRVVELGQLKDQIFRVHTIRQEEVLKMKLDDQMIYHRLRRAILERSIDMLWIQPLEGVNINSIIEKLKAEFGEPADKPSPQQIGSTLPAVPFILILLLISSYSFMLTLLVGIVAFFNFDISVFSASIIATVTTYVVVKNKKYLPITYLILGLLTYASLSRYDFLNDLLQFRGVKLSLVALPFLVTLMLIFQNLDLIKKYRKYLPYFAVAFGLIGLYYITRSGNFAFVLDFERRARDFAETLLWVRPRLKEVIGYLAFFTYLRFSRNKIMSFLQILGAIALVSTFNTFCHIKTPLIVSLYRSVFSILLGYLTFYILRKVKNVEHL